VVLKEATGLLLKPQMFKPQIVPVETIVIDSVDKVPTENGAIELYAMPHPLRMTAKTNNDDGKNKQKIPEKTSKRRLRSKYVQRRLQIQLREVTNATESVTKK
jgi:hypothetical protein